MVLLKINIYIDVKAHYYMNTTLNFNFLFRIELVFYISRILTKHREGWCQFLINIVNHDKVRIIMLNHFITMIHLTYL